MVGRQRNHPSRPALAALETDVRQKLADRAEWLTGAKLVARDATSVTLSVWNEHQADNVRRFCGADILAAAGASELLFEIILPAPARRRS